MSRGYKSDKDLFSGKGRFGAIFCLCLHKDRGRLHRLACIRMSTLVAANRKFNSQSGRTQTASNRFFHIHVLNCGDRDFVMCKRQVLSVTENWAEMEWPRRYLEEKALQMLESKIFETDSRENHNKTECLIKVIQTNRRKL